MLEVQNFEKRLTAFFENVTAHIFEGWIFFSTRRCEILAEITFVFPVLF